MVKVSQVTETWDTQTPNQYSMITRVCKDFFRKIDFMLKTGVVITNALIKKAERISSFSFFVLQYF